MREFDYNGFLLAEYQAKLFEKSVDLNCSSPVFLRRFLHSDLVNILDENDSTILPLDVNEGIKSIMGQFGDTSYGKNKYSKSSLFWMGYMYRYIAYTREQSTSFVMKLFKHQQMNEVFYPYHTQDPEWCISNLLELNNKSEEYFDNNYRLKQVMREKGTY